TVFTGNSLNNTKVGTAGKDFIIGLGGNDTLTGNAGNDTVDGGIGNDTLWATAGDGDDSYIGGAGTDTYNLSATSVAANVNLTLGTASSAQTGNDTLSGIENVIGSSGDNIITDAIGANSLTGGAGNDTFVLLGDDSRDVLVGGVGIADTADYSAATANLTVNLTTTTATVFGTGSTTARSDTVNTIEYFIGGSGNDSITGSAAANVLNGGLGNDILSGVAGKDTLLGGDGDDILTGGLGLDTLTGGAGADRFDFNLTTESGVGAAVRDVITDFLTLTDILDFAGIDADTTLTGDQLFSFDYTDNATFTGVAQLVYHYEGSGASEITVIEGNVNADLGTDFQIALTGHQTFVAADFAL
ncbi:MAG: M10 family metallopeptidase C-terminal domain-containing protein, partial [Methylotenera sp.]